MRAVIFTGAGGNEVVEVVDRPDPVPGSDDVVVAVTRAGINPADVSQRRGFYPAPPGSPADVPGLEVAGAVAAIGDGVTQWQVGDRVFGLIGGGGLASRVLVHGRHVARVPDGLSEDEAAAIPEAFITAHDAIRTVGDLTIGETLLVRGANGGVGQAAVQIGVAAGARVLGAVRSEAAAEVVRGLGAEAIVGDDLVGGVKAATSGRGADVALDVVGGQGLADTVRCLAPRGRAVVLSLGAGPQVELAIIELMHRRASLSGSVLRARSVEDKALAVRLFEREVLPLIADGRLRPRIETVIPADRAADAFALLEGGGRTGKILLAFD